MTGSQHLVPAMAASALGFGMVGALLSAIRLPLAQRLALPEARTKRLTSLVSLSLVPMMLISGWLIDEISVYPVLIAGSLALAVGLVALAVSQTVRQALAAILLIGMAGAALGVGSLILMPIALGFNEPAASMNLGTIFFILGTILTPVLLTPCVRRWGLRQSLLGTALLALVPGMLVALAPWETNRMAADHPGIALNSAALWLTAAVLFFYLPLEHTLAARSGRYLTELGHPASVATGPLVGFWLGFLALRLGTGWFLAQDRLVIADFEPWIVWLLAIFAAIVLGNLLGTTNARSASWGLIFLGASLGPIFPTALALVYRLAPQATGTALGTACVFGFLGKAILPYLAAGYGTKQGSARNALRLPMALALILAAVGLVLTLIEGV